ncbi:MAG: hypothetical protein ACOCZK_04730 [Planctomycetota bacterium]
MTWFYLRTAQGVTPVAVDQVRELVRSGRVAPETQAASFDGTSWHSIDAAIAAHTFAVPAGIADAAGTPGTEEPHVLLRTQSGARPVSVAGLRRLLQARQLTPSLQVVSTDGGASWVSVVQVTGVVEPVVAVPDSAPAQAGGSAAGTGRTRQSTGPGRSRGGDAEPGRTTRTGTRKGKGKGKRKGKKQAPRPAVAAEPNGWDVYIDVLSWITLVMIALSLVPLVMAVVTSLSTPLLAGLLLFPVVIELLLMWLQIGLLRRRRWARTIMTPLCYLGLLGIPVGTVICWYMLKAFQRCGKRFA